MNQQISSVISFVFAFYIALSPSDATLADEASGEVVGTAHAKGFVIVKLSFPTRGDVKRISLAISRDGENFESADAGVTRGQDLLESVSHNRDETTVFVPLVGRFTRGDERFLFDEPGIYWLRWSVGFAERDVAGFKVHQIVDVAPALREDSDFLLHISKLEFLRVLYGSDPLAGLPDDYRKWAMSQAGVDYRALMIILELLKATSSLEPLEERHTTAEEFLRWTNTMFLLSKQFSESTYAPYTSFYAGGGYVTYLCEMPECRNIDPHSARQHDLYSKAVEALNVVVRHGDSYLLPRAICQQARLSMRIGEFDHAEELLNRLSDGLSEKDSIGVLVNEMRRQITSFRKDQQFHSSEP